MYTIIIFLSLLVIVQGPPVVDKKKVEGDDKVEIDEELQNLEYKRYLQEVVNVLESHPEFKKKLETENPEYIKSGKIADHLDEMIPTDLRDKLSEIKLKEIERLRELYRKMIEIDGAQNIAPPEHIDHSNLRSFEKEDLKKLIQKTTRDLEALDRKRTEEFKQYEMKKELEKRRKLAAINNEAERLRVQKEFEAKEKAHQQHPKMHHPGSKDQLEEVWEEVDELPKDNFDPKTFFGLHDLDGNGMWDEHELNSLFQKELDKVYNDSDPNDDPRERIEEMERMKVHVMEQMDKDKDRMISLDEFLEDTKTEDYNKDEGWESLDQQQIYSPEEYRRYQEEIARRNGWQMPPGGYPAYYPPQDYVGQPQPYHPQGGPQGQVPPYPGQVPPHPGIQYPHSGGQGAPPHPGQQYPNQVPVHPGQVHAGQVPPREPVQGQVPAHQGQPDHQVKPIPPKDQPAHGQPPQPPPAPNIPGADQQPPQHAQQQQQQPVQAGSVPGH